MRRKVKRRCSARAASLTVMLGAGALVLTGCAIGPGEPPAPSVDAPATSVASAESASPSASTMPTPTPTPVADRGTFTFNGIDGVRIGMSANDFAAAFPAASFWPGVADDPSFGPAGTFASRLQAVGVAGLGDGACPIIGTPFEGWTEVQFENGVVVAIVKQSSGRQGDPGVQFTTNEGRTAASTLGDFKAEFGEVFVAQDAGRERWVMKGPEGRTMQVGGFASGTSAPVMIGVMDADHSMRFKPRDWAACDAVHNGRPDFS